jgi:putative ABC transport system ATP-binding protein
MLQTKELRFSYDNGREFSFPDFTCLAGEALLITGQSGCGKTTLLHLMAGILHPKSGSIKIGEADLSQMSATEADRFRGQNIGLVYQKPHFLAALTVLENLQLPPFFGHKSVEKKTILALAEQLGIGHTLQQAPARLSVGEQQRASIARALVNHPQLILADEPTSALDDNNCETVIQLLTQQAQLHKAALVIVTHDGRLKEVVKKQVALST